VIIPDSELRIPVVYQDWAEWRIFRRRESEPVSGVLVERDQSFLQACGLCWGSACYLEQASNGEGLVPRPCPQCRGTGVHGHDGTDRDATA
jgi:hypothetical protein